MTICDIGETYKVTNEASGAGYQRHRKLGESVCDECKAAYARYRGRRRVNSKGNVDEFICRKSTSKYPSGRTGTVAGYHAHVSVGGTPCEKCTKAVNEYNKRMDRAGLVKLVKPLRVRKLSEKEHYYLTQSEKQHNSCAICGVEDNGPKRHHIDHKGDCCPHRDSDGKKVPNNTGCSECRRGLLCRSCNLLLGLAKEDESILLGAIEYLKNGGYLEARGER